MATQVDRWPAPAVADRLMPARRISGRLDALGIADPRTFHDDYLRYQSNWTAGLVGTGAVSTLATGRGGVVQLNTGANASSEAYLAMQSAGVPGLVANPTTEGWYFGCRFKITTVPDAQTFISLGLLNVANTRNLGLGARGADSTTKFIARIGTATLTSTVNLDTAWHTGELWGTGTTTLYLSIDGEPPVSGVMGGIPADSFLPFLSSTNGTTAAAQTVQVDDVTYVFGAN